MTFFYPPPPPPRGNNAKVVALVALALVAVGVLLVTIFGLRQMRSTSTTVRSLQPTTSVVYTPAEQQYLSNLHVRGVTGRSNSEVLAAGQSVCTAVLDYGTDPGIEARNLEAQGWSLWSSTAIVARALVDLCPPR